MCICKESGSLTGPSQRDYSPALYHVSFSTCTVCTRLFPCTLSCQLLYLHCVYKTISLHSIMSASLLALCVQDYSPALYHVSFSTCAVCTRLFPCTLSCQLLYLSTCTVCTRLFPCTLSCQLLYLHCMYKTISLHSIMSASLLALCVQDYSPALYHVSFSTCTVYTRLFPCTLCQLLYLHCVQNYSPALYHVSFSTCAVSASLLALCVYKTIPLHSIMSASLLVYLHCVYKTFPCTLSCQLLYLRCVF